MEEREIRNNQELSDEEEAEEDEEIPVLVPIPEQVRGVCAELLMPKKVG